MLSLRTKRLVLRDYICGDEQAVHAFAADPDVVKYRVADVKTPEQVRAFILQARSGADMQPRTSYELAVVQIGDDRLVGEAKIVIENFHHDPNFDGSQARLGYALAPAVWGRGYATEIVRGLLRFGFDTLCLHRIYAACVPENFASSRVLSKAGLRQEAHYKSSLWMKDAWRDVLLFAMLRSEWRPS